MSLGGLLYIMCIYYVEPFCVENFFCFVNNLYYIVLHLYFCGDTTQFIDTFINIYFYLLSKMIFNG